MDVKLCLECKNPVRGRADKRFCDDACRNAYNNRINSSQNDAIRKINGILRKNRRILQEILGQEKMIKITKERLLTAGFDFSYFTQHLHTSKGQQYIFTYEYGYLHIAENSFLIVKKKDT
jgi:hypothetical protein